MLYVMNINHCVKKAVLVFFLLLLHAPEQHTWQLNHFQCRFKHKQELTCFTNFYAFVVVDFLFQLILIFQGFWM